jgi:hypothetical protein
MTAIVGARSNDPDAAGRIVAGRLDEADADTPAATAEIVSQARDAFASGLSTILLVAGVVSFASCVAALRLLPAKDAAPSPATD